MSEFNLARIEKLVAALLLHQLKGESQAEKIRHLNLAGLSNVEVADLLQTTSATVSQTLYANKLSKPAKRKK